MEFWETSGKEMNNLDPKIKELANILQVEYKDLAWLFQAVTHRSYLNEVKKEELRSNERLEFLGDSVLSFWVSGVIFNKFPELPEGKLTFIRTHLVRTETLSGLAKKLGLGNYLYMSKGEEQGGGRENPLLLANCFEAIIGSIFIDSGVETVSGFLNRMLEPLISVVKDTDALKDSKSLLQELVQGKGLSFPIYQVINSTGPDHMRSFTMGVFVDSKQIAEGTAKSKQEAEEEAAKAALEILSKTS